MDILEALSALDPDNKEDWTKDGLPKTDVVSDLVGEPITRAQITEAAPLFTKDNLVLEVTSPDPEVPFEPGTDPDTPTDEEGGENDGGINQDEYDDEQENIADESDAPVTGMGRDHPEVVKTGKALEDAAKALKKAQEAHTKASKAHSATVQKYAPLTQTPEENQKGIMTHIEADLKRKEAKFTAAQAVNTALAQIGNPIDRANVKPEHRGHGNLHQRG